MPCSEDGPEIQGCYAIATSRGKTTTYRTNVKGEAVIDIVDSAEEHDKDTREGATHAAVSRQPKAVGTHKGREADDGKGSDGVDTTRAGLKA